MTSDSETTRTGASSLGGIFGQRSHFLAFHRERDLQKQVTTVKQQLRDLRMSNESTQAKLLDQGSRQGELIRLLPGDLY